MKYLNAAYSIGEKGTSETTAILIDYSPSMYEQDWPPNRITAAIEAVKALLQIKQENHPDDAVLLIGFAGKATRIHNTAIVRRDYQSLVDRLEFDHAGGYGTNITSALSLAQGQLLGMSAQLQKKAGIGSMIRSFFIESDEEPGVPVSHHSDVKRIILLTDGAHNSDSSPLPVSQELKQADVVIDCIGIGGSPDNVDESTLKEIATRNCDGSIRYYFIGDKQQLIRKYRELAQHIRPT